MPNGIDLVLADHRRVDALFAKFNETPLGSYAGMIFDSLAAHDDAENGALYPLALGLLGDATLLERAETAHSQVKKLIDQAKNVEGEHLIEVMAMLQAAVEAHVQDEEKNLLPKIESHASAAELEGLAARWEQIKQRVG
jgi:hemerythrin superfamily protein